MYKQFLELLNDSVFDLQSYIATEFARRIGTAEESAFFTGNGTGKPTGILNATGGATVGVTSAAATAITLDEVMDLFYALRSPYRKNAVFVTNVTGGSVYLRTLPSTSGAIRAVVRQGDLLESSGGAVSGWFPVVHDDEVCYISGKYAELAET